MVQSAGDRHAPFFCPKRTLVPLFATIRGTTCVVGAVMADATRACPGFRRISRGLRMLRRSTLSHARPTLLLLVFAIALPTQAAQSQDRAMQDRLDRLERDLSMLQRQVYRSAGGSVVPTGSGAAVDNELRMDRIETQMRDLTGRVEDAINGVEQLRRRLEQINSDIDVRFGQSQGQPTPPPSRPTGGPVASAAAGTLPARGAPGTLP